MTNDLLRLCGSSRVTPSLGSGIASLVSGQSLAQCLFLRMVEGGAQHSTDRPFRASGMDDMSDAIALILINSLTDLREGWRASFCARCPTLSS